MKKVGLIIKKKRLNTYENIKLRNEAYKLNIELDVLFIEEISCKITNKGIILLYQGQPFSQYLFIINRLGSSINQKEVNIIDTINMVYPVINNGSTTALLKDKYQVALRLLAHNINIIPSMIVEYDYDLNTIKNYMQYPLVKKSNSGSIGKGIYLLKDDTQLIDMLDHSALIARDYFYILQDFIDFKIGVDIRVIVYLGKVICAMQRSSNNGDFKANYTIHQNACVFEVDEKLAKLALKIVDILNCPLAGIDFIESETGYIVCEVNSSPGFKGMDHVQNFSLAKILLQEGIKYFTKEQPIK